MIELNAEHILTEYNHQDGRIYFLLYTNDSIRNIVKNGDPEIIRNLIPKEYQEKVEKNKAIKLDKDKIIVVDGKVFYNVFIKDKEPAFSTAAKTTHSKDGMEAETEQVSNIKYLASHSIDLDRIEKKLNDGEETIVKLGIDATSPSLHIGHLVVINALKSLIEQGCIANIIIGRSTAKIGDPSGRDESRELLSDQQVIKNTEMIEKQISQILGEQKNWRFYKQNQPSIDKLCKLQQSVSVNMMLGRDHFAERQKNDNPISLLELNYPLFQAYDSIQMGCDLEIGGNDQLANCHLTRDLMNKFGITKEALLLFPILTGTDGKRKMSKTFDNHISLDDDSNDIYGKTMSIPDDIISEWYRLIFHKNIDTSNPLHAKQCLAYDLTKKLCSGDKAKKEEQWFNQTFRERIVVPRETIQIRNRCKIREAIVIAGLAKSKTEAIRLINQKGIKMDGFVLSEDNVNDLIPNLCVLQKGKRHAVQLHVVDY